MAGLVVGLGECAFQYSSGEMRRVSKLIPQDGGGIALMKTLIGGVMKGFEQIPADGLLVYFKPLNEEFAGMMEKFWGSIILQPSNGRLPSNWKLDK
jgi:hypothetical protein